MPRTSSPIDRVDPDGPGTGAGLFGLDPALSGALVQVIPVPWEATASYGRGTRRGPAAILAASRQVDLYDLDFGDAWRSGIALLPEEAELARWADEAEAPALRNIEAGGGLAEEIARVDALSERVNERVYTTGRKLLDTGRIPAVIGGDHSCPYGLIRAVAERHPGLGILHVDAHADLRDAYLGFRHSHASIFHNVLALPDVGRVVGVGYRDVGEKEVARIRTESDRIRAWFDPAVARLLAGGEKWSEMCRRIVEELPDPVYVSFDIDGLDPVLCPHTGTPVPGGLSFRDVQVLLRTLSERRRVVGFDLCEVAPGASDGAAHPLAGGELEGGRSPPLAPCEEWDANVGARVLYKLAGCAIRSLERPVRL